MTYVCYIQVTCSYLLLPIVGEYQNLDDNTVNGIVNYVSKYITLAITRDDYHNRQLLNRTHTYAT